MLEIYAKSFMRKKYPKRECTGTTYFQLQNVNIFARTQKQTKAVENVCCLI